MHRFADFSDKYFLQPIPAYPHEMRWQPCDCAESGVQLTDTAPQGTGERVVKIRYFYVHAKLVKQLPLRLRRVKSNKFWYRLITGHLHVALHILSY